LALSFLRVDAHGVAHGRLTGAHVRAAVDRHYTFEADAHPAVQPARSAVARSGPEHSRSRSEKGRRDAFALEGKHRLAIDEDLHRVPALKAVIDTPPRGVARVLLFHLMPPRP